MTYMIVSSVVALGAVAACSFLLGWDYGRRGPRKEKKPR